MRTAPDLRSSLHGDSHMSSEPPGPSFMRRPKPGHALGTPERRSPRGESMKNVRSPRLTVLETAFSRVAPIFSGRSTHRRNIKRSDYDLGRLTGCPRQWENTKNVRSPELTVLETAFSRLSSHFLGRSTQRGNRKRSNHMSWQVGGVGPAMGKQEKCTKSKPNWFRNSV